MEYDPRLYEQIAVSDNDTHNIVLSYLVHNCFKETVESFICSTGIKKPGDCLEDIDRRKKIIKFALDGNALKAIELTEQLAADLLEKNKDLHFELLSLHFIELVRSKRCTEALEFAQKNLSPFGKVQTYVKKLEDLMALLAYEEPEKSPMFHLFSLDRRQLVADDLNRAILVFGYLQKITWLILHGGIYCNDFLLWFIGSKHPYESTKVFIFGKADSADNGC